MRGTANKTLRSVHNKSTKRKTSPGWTPSPESFLMALPSRKCGSLQKISKTWKARLSRWIAAVSAAKEFLKHEKHEISEFYEKNI